VTNHADINTVFGDTGDEIGPEYDYDTDESKTWRVMIITGKGHFSCCGA
jgi:hypothetical protein